MSSVITFKQTGDFRKTFSFLETATKFSIDDILNEYGKIGVNALMSATPVDTGLTANSWSYEISKSKNSYTISFHNSNIVKGVPIAIILQYGHGTGTGGWVEGRDYINPAIQPIFDEITKSAWMEVINS